MCGLIFVTVTWLAVPRLSAMYVEYQFENSKRPGAHGYLDETVRDEINGWLDVPKQSFPPASHSYQVELERPTIKDWMLGRQPVTCDYISHPILPRFTGPIKRHRVQLEAGWFCLRIKGHEESVLYEYFE